MEEKTLSLLNKYGNDKGRLMDILIEIQDNYNYIPERLIKIIADRLDISTVDVEQTISFYHFLSVKPVGKYAIYLNNSAVANLIGRADVAEAFEKELGIPFNNVSQDQLVGLWDTADIGMNDQEPAALINGTVFTSLDLSKVKKIVSGIKSGPELKNLAGEVGGHTKDQDLLPTMVKNNIRKKGAVLFSEYEVGKALKQAVTQSTRADCRRN